MPQRRMHWAVGCSRSRSVGIDRILSFGALCLLAMTGCGPDAGPVTDTAGNATTAAQSPPAPLRSPAITDPVLGAAPAAVDTQPSRTPASTPPVSNVTPAVAAESPKDANAPAGGIEPKPPQESVNLKYFREQYPQPREFAASPPDVFFLDLHDRVRSRTTLQSGSLYRELCRQALLLTAREELGLATRDRALREEFGASHPPTEWPVSVITSVDREFSATVTVIQDRPPQVRILWEQVIPLDPETPYESLTEAMERLSREEFRTVLATEGIEAVRAPKTAGDDALDEELERRLMRFNDISQFAVVRELHALIASDGESPLRLAALARGYANLSLLTYAHYSPMLKVFAARSLLYAQRLRIKFPESPHGAWTQAYVLALAGLPESALRDLAESQALTTGVESPSWLKSIVAYCQGNVDELRRIAAENQGHPFATVLLWRTAHYRANEVARFRAIAEVLEREPDCLRAMFDMPLNDSLGAKASARLTLERLPGVAARRLPEVADLPASITEQLDEDRLAAGEEFAKLCQELKRLGAAGADSQELSLDVLGQLLRESAFVATWQLMDYEQNALGVSVKDRGLELASWATGHPYAQALIARAASGHQWGREGAAFLAQIEADELELFSGQIVVYFRNADRFAGNNLYVAASEHSDAIATELYPQVRGAVSDRDRQRRLAILQQVAKQFPSTIEARLKWNPQSMRDEVAQIEVRFADDASMLNMLSGMYLVQGDSLAAERCARRWISVDPCYDSWQALAEVKKLTGDTEGWIEASNESLGHPVFGLEHAQVQSAIARHYLDADDAEQALPYAEGAARTGAAWAMLRAAEVHERLGNMEEAEQYQRFTAQRYEDSAANWFLWCLRTGEGDLESAREFAEQTLKSWGPELSDANHMRAAMAEMVLDDWDAAYQRMLGVARKSRDPFYLWFAAMLADTQDAAAERSELLQRIIALENSGDDFTLPGTAAIARALEAQLATGSSAALDVDQLDLQVAALHPSGMTNMWYFLSQFLANQGQEEPSLDYLRRAANSPYPELWTQHLAAYFLRSEGEKVDLREDEFLPPATPPNAAGSELWQHSRPAVTVRFPDDGLVMFSDLGGRFFDWQKGASEATQWSNAQGYIADVFDGSRVLLIDESGKSSAVWQRGAEQAESLIPGSGALVRAARFLKNDPGRIVCADTRHNSETVPGSLLRVHELAAGKDVWSVDLAHMSIRGLSTAAPDGSILVPGQLDGRTGWMGQFSAADGTLIREIELPQHPIDRLAVSADGKRAATLSSYGEICILDLAALQVVQRFWQPGATFIALSPEGGRLAVVAAAKVHIYDLEQQAPIGTLADHLQLVNQVAFSPDGKKFVSVSSDMTVRVHDVASLSSPGASVPEASLFETSNSLGMKFVPIPAGEFMMGEREAFQITPGYRHQDLKWERPQHRVRLTRAFRLSKFETTVGQFQQFVEATGYVTEAERNGSGSHRVAPQGVDERRPEFTWRTPGFEQNDTHPVVQVTWNDAQAFCEWLSKKERRRYRLPTEAEWEYSCRAGSPKSWSGFNYLPRGAQTYGNVADLPLMELYDFYGTASHSDDGFAYSAPVGTYRPNAWGLHDMHANVWEWCSDVYDAGAYAHAAAITVDPGSPREHGPRIQRSGSFLGHSDDSRSAHRGHDAPSNTDSTAGFRVLLELPAE